MKVSIIISTLNEEKTLPGLLDSIRLQDFDDYEIIIAGASAANGDFLFFLDADVILPHLWPDPKAFGFCVFVTKRLYNRADAFDETVYVAEDNEDDLDFRNERLEKRQQKIKSFFKLRKSMGN